MELINKQDAIRAVLHHTGDAAVAAVQAINPTKVYDDLLEEHLELIRRLPKAFREPMQYRFCPYCGEQGIHLRCDEVEFHVRGIQVKYDELTAECSSCGQEIYVPSINDWNCENREFAYKVAKSKRGESDERTD